ncbi:minor tail protein [Arthrobacter phage BlueFeather]|uniref:Minor tail protein n=1 Tax=Arthrobacter phage BlueFeather TaxID=2713258 RepID=A0A6G8R287_9CAUD|nr:minor tail protein [Arthrobacter phage BlueFeather]QIN94317.1 minor tail protein [Arthrobacter phage BlueFeather]
MPETLGDAISYPAGGVAPNVPLVMQQSAESVQAAFNKFKAGSVTIAMGAGVAFVNTTVTFPGGGFDSIPQVLLTLNANVAGRASLLQVYAINKTQTNFQIKLATSDNANIGTSYNISVDWLAVDRA